MYQEYPKCKYHRTGKTVTVKDKEEEAELGEGWASSPAGPFGLPEDSDPCRWLFADEIRGLPLDARKRIGAALWEAHAFIHESSADSGTEARRSSLKKAFDLFAQEYFSAGLLTKSLMNSVLPILVYDAAVSGGWETGAGTRNRRCTLQFGRYWVPAEVPGLLKSLFQPQIFKWEAKLMRPGDDVPRNLSSDELGVLTILAEAFPERLHLDQVALRTSFGADRGRLLRATHGLMVRALIECTPLRGSEGLEDAANILISSSGSKLLSEAEKSESKELSAPGDAWSLSAPLQATVLKVLIASPSDVAEEREAVASAIDEWNANHHEQTGMMLHAVRWQTHSYPVAGDRPQALLNKQIVDTAHFLIGIFGSRLGTPTGKTQSGTIEEIEEFRKTGRHVALYFSTAPFPRDADLEQLAALRAYQLQREHDTLYRTFNTPEELRQLVTQHLPGIVSAVRRALSNTTRDAQANERVVPSKALQPRAGLRPSSHPAEDLSPREIELLWNAARSSNGEILHSVSLDGEDIRANDRHFLLDADARSAAEWRGALRHLEHRGFIEPLGEQRTFFTVTDAGYKAADQLNGFARWTAEKCILRARYLNAPTEERLVVCKGIVAIPARYLPDNVAADGGVMRTLKERRSLLIEKATPRPPENWEPNEVEFTDPKTGVAETFRIEGMHFVPPDTLRLPMV